MKVLSNRFIITFLRINFVNLRHMENSWYQLLKPFRLLLLLVLLLRVTSFVFLTISYVIKNKLRLCSSAFRGISAAVLATKPCKSKEIESTNRNIGDAV